MLSPSIVRLLKLLKLLPCYHYTVVTHHLSNVLRPTKVWLTLLTSCPTQIFVPGQKVTRNRRLLTMIVSYSVRKPLERRIQNVLKNCPTLPTSCSTQKLVQDLKMTKNKCSRVIYCWKTHEKKFLKSQKKLTCPTKK